MSFSEFQKLTEDLSKKVNLFQSVWMKDPDAEFFGGTSRDFAYWVRGQFRGLKTRSEVEAKIKELRKLSLIDARHFIIGDSDIDVASDQQSLADLASIFKVRRVDQVSRDRFQADTEDGKNELLQGYIPVEKIRLGKNGFIPWLSFKDGLREVFDGKPTVHYSRPEEFRETKYAKEGINHPILLALRYLRILGINYFQIHGSGYPDREQIELMDERSRIETRSVIDLSLRDPKVAQLLKNEKFKKWMNGSIVKAFRSHTNPTAALYIYRFFKADLMVSKFSRYLEPLNQYLFAKAPMKDEVREERLQPWGFSYSEIFKDITNEFPDLRFIHGVKSGPSAFRSILREGILPSEYGNAGRGLYGVSIANKKFSEDWAQSPDLVVEFPILSGAKMVDISKGAGLKLFRKFGKSEDEFCEYFGIQILKYPYDVPAFVVKDSTILGKAEPLYNKTKSVSEIFDEIDSVSNIDRALEIIFQVENMDLTLLEHQLIMDLIIEPWLDPYSKEIHFKSLLDGFTFLNRIAPRYLTPDCRLELAKHFNLEAWADQDHSMLDTRKLFELYHHDALKLFSENRSKVFLEKFKKNSLIPNLKRRAADIVDWREIIDLSDYLMDLSFTDIERQEILDSISISWFHSDPMASSVKRILAKVGTLKGRKAFRPTDLKVTVALGFLAYFLSLKNRKSNRDNIENAKRELGKALEWAVIDFIKISGTSLALLSEMDFLVDATSSTWIRGNFCLLDFLSSIKSQAGLVPPLSEAIGIAAKLKPRGSYGQWLQDLFRRSITFQNKLILKMAASVVILLWFELLFMIIAEHNPGGDKMVALAILGGVSFGFFSEWYNFVKLPTEFKLGRKIMKNVKKEFARMIACKESLSLFYQSP